LDIWHALIFRRWSINRIYFSAQIFCGRINYVAVMFEIRHDGIPRTYRDLKMTAYDAARLAKERSKVVKIEIVDLTTGEKVQIPEDRRATPELRRGCAPTSGSFVATG
jgi:hypothetical protein